MISSYTLNFSAHRLTYDHTAIRGLGLPCNETCLLTWCVCVIFLETVCKLGVANEGVVYATCDYKAKNADELSFAKGKRLKVARKGDGSESEWWWATVDGHHGYVPQNLLAVCAILSPHHSRFSIHSKRCISTTAPRELSTSPTRAGEHQHWNQVT